MAWIDPITNRVAGAKYNHIDLNRVSQCVEYLAGVLNGYGYKAVVDVKTDWTQSDKPRAGQMETYLNNLQALIDTYYTLPDAPEKPESMNNLNWQGANNIEKLLIDIKEIIRRMEAGFRKCGTFKCGQGVILP